MWSLYHLIPEVTAKIILAIDHLTIILVEIILFTMQFVIRGIMVNVHMVMAVRDGMFAGPVLPRGSWENPIKLLPMLAQLQRLGKEISGFSASSPSRLPSSGDGTGWSTSAQEWLDHGEWARVYAVP